jgi:hypothetical protein
VICYGVFWEEMRMKKMLMSASYIVEREEEEAGRRYD